MTVFMGNALIDSRDELLGGQAYTLTVLNENSKFQQFALFQTIPDVIGPSTNPVSLAWMLGSAAAGSTKNPSRSQFYWQINYSVTAGYIQELGSTLDPRRFTTSTNTDVMIEKQNTVAVTYQGTFPNGAPAFPTNPTNGKGGLIITQSDDKIPTALQQGSVRMSLNVGIAMNNKPTIAVQLEPNLTYQFTPKPKYYILAGAFVEGQVIDTATSSQAYEVQYLGVTDMQVRFTNENQFVAA